MMPRHTKVIFYCSSIEVKVEIGFRCQQKTIYAQGVITERAWIKEMETELSDSKVFTLPGGFKPVTLKSLVSSTGH
jgi:cob(I)alamin adenosyltransferase